MEATIVSSLSISSPFRVRRPSPHPPHDHTMSKRRAETPPVRESTTKSIDSVNVHEDFLSELPSSELVKTWDSTTLLSWLKALKPSPLGTVHFTNTATAFKQADISGRAFLRATANWLEEKCHIFAGPAMDLEGLAAEINAAKQNEQSITAPKMRKTVLEHTAKSKYMRVNGMDKLRNLLTLIQIVLNSKVHRLPVEVEEFCDPWNREYLPFPFPGVIPLHFKLDNDRQFFYYGRTDLRLLYEKAILLNPYQAKNLAVYGPFGGGKSHMLAALVCLLGRLKKTVVYIPDCHELNTPSRCSYLIQALVFAFANDHFLGEKITELARICEDNSDPKELEPKVISFCNEAASKGQFILFVLDQADSLDENSSKIIRHIITPHMTITCSNKQSVDCQLYVPAQAPLFITGELDEVRILPTYLGLKVLIIA
jgi:Cdc6-like AAA superfamily ATPase